MTAAIIIPFFQRHEVDKLNGTNPFSRPTISKVENKNKNGKFNYTLIKQHSRLAFLKIRLTIN